MAVRQTQQTWIPALPEGWEARFDHNQKAYFFINHTTRKTQWDDPRFSRPAPAQPQQQAYNTSGQQQHAAAAAASSLGHRGAHSGDHELHPLQEISQGQRSRTNSASRSHQAESSLSEQHTAAIVDKLKQDFPHATRALITDLFRMCHENERETREQLSDLGFEPSTTSSAASPARHQASAAAERTPVREPSEADKQRMLSQLKSAFSSIDENVIQIALSTCAYKKADAKELLSAWDKKMGPEESRRVTSTRAGTSASTSVTPTPAPVIVPALLEPAGLDDEASLRPQGLGSSGNQGRQPSSQSSHPSSQQARHAPTPSAHAGGDGPSGTSRGASPSHQPQQHARAKQVTSTGPNRAQRRKAKQNAVVTAQPARVEPAPVRQSAFRTDTRGPDASLRKGPNSSLLSCDYTQAHGPDRSLVVGRDPSRILGPQGSVGPDLTLRCGPQAARQDDRNNQGVIISNV